MLKGAGAAVVLAALGGATAPAAVRAAERSSVRADSLIAAGGGPRQLGYAFGMTRQDVTIFNPATWQALETRPLGATVRWLSNEQRYWDGRSVWTYDFAGSAGYVDVIAIDPRTVSVTQRLATGGAGPAHSVMLTPDRATAWVNVAGANQLAVFDLARAEKVAEVAMGEFP